MGVHSNIHIPRESWPGFLWFAIEFFIVLGAGLGISVNSMDYFRKMGFDEYMINWIFWGLVGVVFLLYYLVLRPIILKKPILKI